MIDFLTTVPGLDFGICWPSRVTEDSEEFSYLFVGKDDLIKSKKTAGRPQDLADIDGLT